MKKISKQEFLEILNRRKAGERLSFREYEFETMDLSGMDLSNIDFVLSSLQHVKLKNVNLENSSLENSLFDGTDLHGANLKNANMKMGAFRSCDLGECNICGADLYASVLENANLEGIISDEDTKWFRLRCPEEGAFLGYKKCVNDRLVQLLIPADAKRSSSTMRCCRCDKAKVLTIKSFDYEQEFDEAWSLVNEDFVYRKGQWVEAGNYNPDRWFDSTGGIHFWLTREEAKAY
ncbi:MAG: pentapeptide repeat-containing protein [Lachnospiraceae bacterium]|nr:pentapeptide repeat-containing protein [Lachnospiraceae bacterium]